MLFMDPNWESVRLCNGETMPHSSTSNGRETAANGAKDRSAFCGESLQARFAAPIFSRR